MQNNVYKVNFQMKLLTFPYVTDVNGGTGKIVRRRDTVRKRQTELVRITDQQREREIVI